MARPYRLQSANCLYHVTSRGNNKNEIFTEDLDFKKFLEYLVKAKDKFHFYLLAYVLMQNHYHLFIETLQANLSRIMHYLNTAFTVYCNKRHERCGHLFQGRYKSIVVDRDNYFLELTRYIHLNPVRAKLVAHPREYKWSSYTGFMEKGGNDIIDKVRIGSYMDIDINEYEKFVLAGIGKKKEFEKDIYAGYILGKSKFVKEILQDSKACMENEDISFRRNIRQNVVNVDKVVRFIGERYGYTAKDLYVAKKEALKVRKMAIYLLKNCTGLMNKEIGEAFGITYSAVSKAAVDVERDMGVDARFKKETKSLISHFKG